MLPSALACRACLSRLEGGTMSGASVQFTPRSRVFSSLLVLVFINMPYLYIIRLSPSDPFFLCSKRPAAKRDAERPRPSPIESRNLELELTGLFLPSLTHTLLLASSLFCSSRSPRGHLVFFSARALPCRSRMLLASRLARLSSSSTSGGGAALGGRPTLARGLG